MSKPWEDTIEFIKDECNGMSIWYSIELGWCFITDRKAVRHKIDNKMDMDTVKYIIKCAKRARGIPQYTIG